MPGSPITPVPPDDRASAAGRWRLGIETGGTFTDAIGIAPDGRVHRVKVLSAGVLRLPCAPVAGDAPRCQLIEPFESCSLVGFGVSGDDRGRVASVIAHRGRVLTFDVPPPVGTAGIGGGPVVLELSTGEPAPVVAARLLTGTPVGSPLPPSVVRFATTRATNAILERRLTPTVLLVTEGFADLLVIGDQRRPRLFDLDIRRAPPMYAEVIEVRGRIDASGREVTPLDLEGALASARASHARGIRAAAIALMHSWTNPAHERALARALRGIGFEHVSASADLSRRIRILHRARTAVVNAALSGPVESYLARTAAAWAVTPGDDCLRLDAMTSAGGLAEWRSFVPKDALLSGPAAGVRGAVAAARRAGLTSIIAFDMGGTSTDVTRLESEPELEATHRIGDAEILSPAMPVHSVAAGGGSLCAFDLTRDSDGRVRARPTVGPRSAGADPGPACYGRGGPLTVTDVNLLLGRLDPHRFGIPLSVGAARRAFDALTGSARAAGAMLDDDPGILRGFIDIANQRMSAAIAAISVRRGYDPAESTLVAFGGAGGQHACAVADALGMTAILCPGEASLLSAAGLLASRRQIVRERQVLAPLAGAHAALVAAFRELEERARAELADSEDALGGPIRTMSSVSLRYVGQDHAFSVPWTPDQREIDLGDAFVRRARSVLGYALRGRAIEVESIRVVVTPEGADDDPGRAGARPREAATVRTGSDEGDDRSLARGSMVIERCSLGAGGREARGPALIVDRETTVVLDPGWSASARDDGSLMLRRTSAEPGGVPPNAPGGRCSAAVADELLAGRLETLGRSMGELLARTAMSTNVKERLDFSCAILDRDANLVVSAPHVPVHLGALGVCVRAIRDHLSMTTGDVVITNHPAFGGSHLPDVTLVAPAHDDAGALIGYVACRAHHAEIGGTRPGSMPPDATCLAHEGVVIPPRRLAWVDPVGEAAIDWDGVRSLLLSAAWPSRAVDENLADLAAQLAAVSMGVHGLRAAARDAGTDRLRDAMNAILSRAESRASDAIGALIDGPVGMGVRAEASLDDGWRLRAAVRADAAGAPTLSIDMSGSSGLHPRSLNAPAGVIHSAVMYVVRLLVTRSAGADADVPLCDGLMRRVRLVIPEGFLNPPWHALGDDPARLPAVAGGNVETSQQVVNLLVRALGLAAESQGTMNNLLFGASGRAESGGAGYYETIGGGAGATPTASGADGLHTHMTNTAITDPEILEHRHPVRLDRFAIRCGSGGAGRHRGGDGLDRRITFLAPMNVSLLTSNRGRPGVDQAVCGPRGLAGGGPGAPGRQWLIRPDGSTRPLAHADAFEASPGDQLVIHTPGGGGWGAPRS